MPLTNVEPIRILLVEDDPRLAEMLSEYLGQAGFRINVAVREQSTGIP